MKTNRIQAFRITSSTPYSNCKARITVDLIGWENSDIKSLWSEHFPKSLRGLSDARLSIEMCLYEPYNDQLPSFSFPRVMCSGAEYMTMGNLIELAKALNVIEKKMRKMAETRGESSGAEYVMRMAEALGVQTFLTKSRSGDYMRVMAPNDARYHLESSMREAIEALTVKPAAPLALAAVLETAQEQGAQARLN